MKLEYNKWNDRSYEGYLNELGRIEVASGGWPAGDCNIGAEECAIKWTSYSDIRYIGLRVILPSGVTVFPPPLSLSHSVIHTHIFPYYIALVSMRYANNEFHARRVKYEYALSLFKMKIPTFSNSY